MSRRIIPRELAAKELAVSTRVLLRYESLGLVQVTNEGPEQGYEPAAGPPALVDRELSARPGNQPGRRRGDPPARRPSLGGPSPRLHLAEELRELLEQGDPAFVSDSHV